MFDIPWLRVSTALNDPAFPFRRTKLYELAQQHDGLIKKLGRASLLNMRLVNKICDELPDAKLRSPAEPKPARRQG